MLSFNLPLMDEEIEKNKEACKEALKTKFNNKKNKRIKRSN